MFDTIAQFETQAMATLHERTVVWAKLVGSGAVAMIEVSRQMVGNIIVWNLGSIITMTTTITTMDTDIVATLLV